MPDLHAELFCDPFAPGTWRHRPLLTHVAYAFGELDWTVRPIAAVPDPLEGEAAGIFRTAAEQAAAAADLPLADDVFTDRVPASWPACEAIVGVRESDADAALPFLKRVSARTFAAGRPPTTPEALAPIAESVGVDPAVVRDAVGSRRATAAVGRDVERGLSLVATLDDHEVRGDPPDDALGTRVHGDGRAGRPTDDGPADESPEPPRDASGDAPGQTGGNAPAPTDGDASISTDGDALGRPVLVDPDSRVPRSPLVRLFAGDYTVVVDPRRGFQEFSDVLRRYDPDLGDLDWQAKLHGRHVMTAYGISQRQAEHLSTERYGEKITGILAETGEAFIPEVAACADLDPQTCRIALGEERVTGAVEQTAAGGWVPANRTD